MRMIWLKRAEKDLDIIFEYIVLDNSASARRVIETIRQSTSRLVTYPQSGRIGRRHNTRELVVPGLPYIVVYRNKDTQIYILEVRHTSRKWPEDFF